MWDRDLGTRFSCASHTPRVCVIFGQLSQPFGVVEGKESRMKKFRVTIPVLASVTLEVEARDQDEAIRKFYEARPIPNPEDWSYVEDL